MNDPLTNYSLPHFLTNYEPDDSYIIATQSSREFKPGEIVALKEQFVFHNSMRADIDFSPEGEMNRGAAFPICDMRECPPPLYSSEYDEPIKRGISYYDIVNPIQFYLVNSYERNPETNEMLPIMSYGRFRIIEHVSVARLLELIGLNNYYYKRNYYCLWVMIWFMPTATESTLILNKIKEEPIYFLNDIVNMVAPNWYDPDWRKKVFKGIILQVADFPEPTHHKSTKQQIMNGFVAAVHNALNATESLKARGADDDDIKASMQYVDELLPILRKTVPAIKETLADYHFNQGALINTLIRSGEEISDNDWMNYMRHHNVDSNHLLHCDLWKHIDEKTKKEHMSRIKELMHTVKQQEEQEYINQMLESFGEFRKRTYKSRLRQTFSSNA